MQEGGDGVTREEILAMDPGHELDELIAIHVMGYEKSRMQDGWVRIGALATYPKRYSTDISAAWEVVEKFDEITIRRYETIGNESRFVCRIQVNHHTQVTNCAKTAPEAICKAALLAVME
jgi:hypothetical protein